MKTILVMSFCVVSFFAAAQAQELEQLKLNLEKLVQLKLMLSQAKQGYQVLQNGYNSVRDASKGNFNLHKIYLDDLMQVSPQVKHSPVIQQINRDAGSVSSEFQKAWSSFHSSGVFKTAELTSFRDEYTGISGKVSDALQMVSLVLSANTLRMNDQERISAVSAVQQDVNYQLSALRSLISDYSKVMAVRLQQKRDNQALKRMKGVN